MKTFLIHPDDSVEILLEAGVYNGTPVPAGHKRARRAVAAGLAHRPRHPGHRAGRLGAQP